jgi:hypothetical protein
MEEGRRKDAWALPPTFGEVIHVTIF